MHIHIFWSRKCISKFNWVRLKIGWFFENLVGMPIISNVYLMKLCDNKFNGCVVCYTIYRPEKQFFFLNKSIDWIWHQVAEKSKSLSDNWLYSINTKENKNPPRCVENCQVFMSYHHSKNAMFECQTIETVCLLVGCNSTNNIVCQKHKKEKSMRSLMYA